VKTVSTRVLKFRSTKQKDITKSGFNTTHKLLDSPSSLS
jgi:hypothetical protein